MSKLYILIFFVFILTSSISAQQTIVFHEDFELPSLDDSITSTTTTNGIKHWEISTNLHSQGNRSDSCTVVTNGTTYITSALFSTLNKYYVVLSFDQISKVDCSDNATIEVSGDSGVTWTKLTNQHYLGFSSFHQDGDKFCVVAYATLWHPGVSNAIPLNSWWKSEQFNVSALLSNKAAAQIRFKLQDAGPSGGNNHYGWLIDNIKVIADLSEFTPPTIAMASNNPVGSTYSLGPFTIKAKIKDNSGIDTAILVFSTGNNVFDTIGMLPLTGDTMYAQIPAVSDSTQIYYKIKAWDNSLLHNLNANPANGFHNLHVLKFFTPPYYTNFDLPQNLWTTENNVINGWQLGTPNFGQTNSAHSAPNAWDISLNSAYTNYADCKLYSPKFKFTGITNATLSFWVNYQTESSWDGVCLEYSTNGMSWTVLGTVNNPLATNWYNSVMIFTNQPAWNGNSGGWKKCTYPLNMFSNMGIVYFRFVFISDGSDVLSGFSIDDFAIELPVVQSAALTKLVSPVSGCDYGTNPVSILLKNTGMNPINPGFTASYKINNGAIFSETVPIGVPVGDSLLFNFSTPINLNNQNDTTFNLKSWVQVLNDPNHNDDTIQKTVHSKIVPPVPIVSNQILEYPVTTTLTASSSFPVEWYNNAFGGIPLTTGNTYSPPALLQTSVFFAEAVSLNGCRSARAGDTVFVINVPEIRGQLRYDNVTSTPLKDTEVTLYQDATAIATTISGPIGNYIFPNIWQPDAYNIKVSCTKPHGSINSVDAMLVMQHFAGAANLSPLQKKAADVNLTGNINSVDALNIMRCFVGLITTFPAGDWVFEDGSIVLADSNDVIKLIKGLCTGDVNGSNTPINKEETFVGIDKHPAIVLAEINTVGDLPVYAEIPDAFNSISLILRYNPSTVRIMEVNPGPELLHDSSSLFLSNVTADEIRIAWFSLNAVNNNINEPVFTIKYELLMPVNPVFEVVDGSMFTNYDGTPLLTKLRIPEIKTEQPGISLTAFPNPSNGNILLTYQVPEQSQITLALGDNLGRKKLLQETKVQAGQQCSFSLYAGQLPAGVYYVQLEVRTKTQYSQEQVKVIVN
jgi:hypothetical protein